MMPTLPTAIPAGIAAPQHMPLRSPVVRWYDHRQENSNQRELSWQHQQGHVEKCLPQWRSIQLWRRWEWREAQRLMKPGEAQRLPTVMEVQKMHRRQLDARKVLDGESALSEAELSQSLGVLDKQELVSTQESEKLESLIAEIFKFEIVETLFGEVNRIYNDAIGELDAVARTIGRNLDGKRCLCERLPAGSRLQYRFAYSGARCERCN